MTTDNSRNILEMSNIGARNFLLKKESYFTLSLPEYFELSHLLNSARNIMGVPENPNYKDAELLNSHILGYRQRDDLNYIIYTSKDGLYSWRPLTIINPFLYIDLVDYITLEED